MVAPARPGFMGAGEGHPRTSPGSIESWVLAGTRYRKAAAVGDTSEASSKDTRTLPTETPASMKTLSFAAEVCRPLGLQALSGLAAAGLVSVGLRLELPQRFRSRCRRM
jgi:hypothetical protein